MREVLNVVLNNSYAKFGMQNGRGRTYEALLTTRFITIAQRYYDFLKKIADGKDESKISEDVHKVFHDLT